MPAPTSGCFTDSLVASDIARGVGRLLSRNGFAQMCEVPLPNNRRADLLAINGKGEILIVEIKVSRADLLGDCKWPDYLDYCDRFFWALPSGFDHSPLADDLYQPARCGIIIADRYDAEILRPAGSHPMPTARRKSETARIARLAMHRMMLLNDPELGVLPRD